MQEPYGADGRHNYLAWLIGLNVGVYLLQVIVGQSTGRYLVEAYLGLSMDSLRHFFLWTPLTYGFLHSPLNPLHLILNMVGLFFMWRGLEPRLGQLRLLQFFLLSILGGALLFLSVSFNAPKEVIGASAGVFGLLTLFCLLYPDRMITILLFFVIPVTIKPRYLLYIMVGITGLSFLIFEFLPLLTGRAVPHDGVSHSAHLGGMATAYLYMKFLMDKAPLGLDRPSIRLPGWVGKKDKISQRAPGYSVNLSSRKNMNEELNRILDKINRSGFQSLTPEERRTLDRGSDLMR